MAPDTPWDREDKIQYGMKWHKTKTLWPKKSFLSGNHILMFSTAYHLSDPAGGIQSDMWLTEEEFIFERLKGNV